MGKIEGFFMRGLFNKSIKYSEKIILFSARFIIDCKNLGFIILNKSIIIFYYSLLRF